MSKDMAVMDLEVSSVPAHLKNFRTDISKNFQLDGGGGRNRIGMKGSRFRLVVNGQEEAIVEESYLDVIIIDSAPKVQRIYFKDKYSPLTKALPTCFSTDGVTPSVDIQIPQSKTCAICPQNEKGSALTDDGTKVKACNVYKRFAVILLNDPEHRIFQLDVKSKSMFGPSKPDENKYSGKDYMSKLVNRGTSPSSIVTRIGFNLSDSFPSVLFTASRYITKEEIKFVEEASQKDELVNVLKITANTVANDVEVLNTEEPKQVVPQPHKPTVKKEASKDKLEEELDELLGKLE